jgi:tripartite ATP-independent transporter DctM subunit
MGLMLMLVIALMAGPRSLPRSARANAHELWDSFKAAFLPLLAPVIIIGGIMTGIFTPTEASVVVCLYAIFLGILYKDLRIRDLPDIFWDSIRQSVGLLFIMAAANFFGWLTIYQRIPDDIISTLTNLSASGASVYGIIIVILLILGLFLEGNAIFLITIPIFLPIAMNYGLDLINLGVVMTLLIMIGNLTPPVGMCLFAVSSFSKIGILELAKECWPYIVGILIVTVGLAYVPEISTWLPNLVMGKVIQ